MDEAGTRRKPAGHSGNPRTGRIPEPCKGISHRAGTSRSTPGLPREMEVDRDVPARSGLPRV